MEQVGQKGLTVLAVAAVAMVLQTLLAAVKEVVLMVRSTKLMLRAKKIPIATPILLGQIITTICEPQTTAAM